MSNNIIRQDTNDLVSAAMLMPPSQIKNNLSNLARLKANNLVKYLPPEKDPKLQREIQKGYQKLASMITIAALYSCSQSNNKNICIKTRPDVKRAQEDLDVILYEQNLQCPSDSYNLYKITISIFAAVAVISIFLFVIFLLLSTTNSNTFYYRYDSILVLTPATEKNFQTVSTSNNTQIITDDNIALPVSPF